MSFKTKTKRIFTALAIAKTLCFNTPAYAGENGFANIFPAYNTRQQHSTIRLEGGSDITPNLNFYAYGDIDATKEKPMDFEDFYAEGRVSYSFGKLAKKLKTIGLSCEANTGNNFEDLVRFGFVWTPNLNKDNFSVLKLFPIETSNKMGQQASFYTEQKLAKGFSASLLADLNFNPKGDKHNFYTEIGVYYNIFKNTDLFLQARGFESMDKFSKAKFNPIIGGRYKF